MAAELIVNNDTNTRWHQLDYNFSKQLIQSSRWAFYLFMRQGGSHYNWNSIVRDADQMYLMGGEL